MGYFVLGLCLVLACITIVQSYGRSSNSKYDSRNSGYARSSDENEIPNKVNKSRGIGISAWGIVILVISLILISVGAYYVVIFYPLLCKKERKYDRIELATV